MNTTGAGVEPADKLMDIDTSRVNLADNSVSDIGNKNQGNNNTHEITQVTSNNSNSISPVRQDVDLNNCYNILDKGPFCVFVEHKDKNIGRLFPLRVGYYLQLTNSFKDSVIDITSVGRNRVKVILKTYKAANNMVGSDILAKQGLIAYIPKYFTQKKGVVKMVDTFFSEDYLLKNIESERKVVEVKRMLRKGVDESGNEKLVPRQIIVVSFQGNSIPQNVRINSVNFQVEPYIHPVIQCKRCLHYGHATSLCRNAESHCKKCGRKHREDECDGDPSCIFCGTRDHPSISRKCPVYIRQRRIKEIMAIQNVSFKEAESLEKNPTYAKVICNNRYNLLSDVNNFPPLPVTNTQTTQQSFVAKPRPPRPSLGPKITQRSQENFRKKRKAAKSPTPDDMPAPTEPPLVIPNPHAQDFRDYKQTMLEKVSTFVEDLIERLCQSNNILFTYNVRENLSQLLADSSHRSSSYNSDAESSY